nr:MAG TPA: hypothetical protein [Caudoviricetes sp.]
MCVRPQFLIFKRAFARYNFENNPTIVGNKYIILSPLGQRRK